MAAFVYIHGSKSHKSMPLHHLLQKAIRERSLRIFAPGPEVGPVARDFDLKTHLLLLFKKKITIDFIIVTIVFVVTFIG